MPWEAFQHPHRTLSRLRSYGGAVHELTARTFLRWAGVEGGERRYLPARLDGAYLVAQALPPEPGTAAVRDMVAAANGRRV